MIKYIEYTGLVSLLFLLSNCDPCLIKRCAGPFAFKIIDKTTRKDLVFVATPVYSKDSIYLWPNPTGFPGSYAVADTRNNKFTSDLIFPKDTLYLRLSFTDIDTIIMNYERIKNKCCDSRAEEYKRIRGMRFNGRNVVKEGDNFIFEK
jgi:hypothetical protein